MLDVFLDPNNLEEYRSPFITHPGGCSMVVVQDEPWMHTQITPERSLYQMQVNSGPATWPC